jgi:hypothetical protein
MPKKDALGGSRYAFTFRLCQFDLGQSPSEPLPHVISRWKENIGHFSLFLHLNQFQPPVIAYFSTNHPSARGKGEGAQPFYIRSGWSNWDEIESQPNRSGHTRCKLYTGYINLILLTRLGKWDLFLAKLYVQFCQPLRKLLNLSVPWGLV